MKAQQFFEFDDGPISAGIMGNTEAKSSYWGTV